jgi:hypothetical protein
MVIVFVTLPRDQSFYILFVFSITKELVEIMKYLAFQPQQYMFNPNYHPAFCNQETPINFGWPDSETFENQMVGFSTFLTIFFTGKNSNLHGDMHKDLHKSRVD